MILKLLTYEKRRRQKIDGDGGSSVSIPIIGDLYLTTDHKSNPNKSLSLVI